MLGGRAGEQGLAGRECGARPALGAPGVLSLAEPEAAVRSGVRDAALLGRAGLSDRQRGAPPRREEAAAAPCQGERRPEAGWLAPVPCSSATSVWRPNWAGTEVTSLGAFCEGFGRTKAQWLRLPTGKGDDGKEG